MFGYSGMRGVFVALAGGFLFASCSSAQVLQAVVPAATADDRERAAELIAGVCDEQAGKRILRTVSNVDGFLLLPESSYGNGRQNSPTDAADGGCGLSCLTYFIAGFSYIEAEVEVPGCGFVESCFESAAGKIRYELVQRSTDQCVKHDLVHRFSPWMQSFVKDSPETFGGKCVAATRVDTFASRYAYQPSYSDQPFLLSEGLVGNKHGSRVIDLQTGDEIAHQTRFSVHDPSLQKHLLSSCGPSHTLNVLDVLKPTSR